MLIPDLDFVFTLISSYSRKIGSRREIGIAIAELMDRKPAFDESSVRKWVRGNKRGEVPDDVGEAIITLVWQSLPNPPMSREEVLTLLGRDRIYLHNAFCPISSRAWSRLVSERIGAGKVTAKFAPPLDATVPARRSLGFGNQVGVSGSMPPDWRIGQRWRYRFGIRPPGGSNQGEAFVLSNKGSIWRPVQFLSGATTPVSGNPWWAPTSVDPDQRYIENDGTTGVFRHFVVAVDGQFTIAERQVLSSDAFGQPEIDALAEALLKRSAAQMALGGVSIEIDPHFDPAEWAGD